jgi:hypothetical protein
LQTYNIILATQALPDLLVTGAEDHKAYQVTTLLMENSTTVMALIKTNIDKMNTPSFKCTIDSSMNAHL